MCTPQGGWVMVVRPCWAGQVSSRLGVDIDPVDCADAIRRNPFPPPRPPRTSCSGHGEANVVSIDYGDRNAVGLLSAVSMEMRSQAA